MAAIADSTCAELLEAWTIEPELAERITATARSFRNATDRNLFIISGHRTEAEQNRLRSEGRPTAPNALSNHVICPARAVDVRMEGFPSSSLKRVLGTAATKHGLRWGGGSNLDELGIPADWNHFDLGPRTDATASAWRAAHA